MTRSAAILLLAAPLPLAAQPPAVTFAPARGGYQVQFPGRPKESSSSMKVDALKVTLNTATFATEDGSVWLVSYTDYPEKKLAGVSTEDFLAAARDGLKAAGGRVVEERAVRRSGVAALDVTIDRGKNHVRSVLVLHRPRLFQVQVLGSKAFVTGPAADQFLNSFTLKK